jgi:RHS repeat-associated protein
MGTDRQYTGQRWEAGIGLYDYNARYYDPALGRFVQADTVVPSPENPQDFNRYSYVRGNPLRYTDPSGHFPWLLVPVLGVVALICTRSGIDPEVQYVRSLNTTAISDLDALVTMFTTDKLSGDTVQERFTTISRRTASVPGFLYTSGGFGEAGLNGDFQDGYMYEQYWGGKTNQIGHFWTAVVYGSRASQSLFQEEFLMRLAVGHEMVGDHRFVRQYFSATGGALDLFRQAIEADILGDYESRDDYLSQILMMKGGNLEDRKGNSLEDLRLTVRGWRFGQMIATGQFASREEAAQWLNDNLQ